MAPGGWLGRRGTLSHGIPTPKPLNYQDLRVPVGDPEGPAAASPFTADPLALRAGRRELPARPTPVQAHGELILTTRTDFHSQKALLFKKVFVAGKFYEFVH